MKKGNIFQKIDTMYTKVVKVIIDYLPFKELELQDYDTSTTSLKDAKNCFCVRYFPSKSITLCLP